MSLRQFLQQHPNARIVLDNAAAAELTRFRTPWLIGSMEEFGLTWDPKQTRRATIWLAQQLKKPLLKLTDEDYNEHGLQELSASRGGSLRHQHRNLQRDAANDHRMARRQAERQVRIPADQARR